MAIGSGLDFQLSMDELREVTRLAVAPVDSELEPLDQPHGRRITAAVQAAKRFI